MSVAARSTRTLQLPPQKPFGQEASLPLAGDEELAKEEEPDSALEELCKPLFCKLCNVTLNSVQQAQAHYQGGLLQAGGRVILATENDYCKLCDASFSSPTVAQAHYQGKNHAKRLRLGEAHSPYFIARSQQRIPRDLAMCITPSGQFYCSMCNVGAGEEVEFQQHLESKQHKSKVSEQRYRSEMENLGYVQ
ncbi:hypothetical protein A6R68_18467 [Neotoma lepida]|uniref:Zinc finger matrin-type protein 3 n=1 Tax=Neotoma lepida TaxID=56216 RepID=A0A1A6HKY2_NEOLE|nr:hypothetical protein A6R68_18467 [Neotoma lepida]